MSWPILVFDRLSRLCPRHPNYSSRRAHGGTRAASSSSTYIIWNFSARIAIIGVSTRLTSMSLSYYYRLKTKDESVSICI